jgi:hypothetical protein
MDMILEGALLRAARPFPNMADLNLLDSIFGKRVLKVERINGALIVHFSDGRRWNSQQEERRKA